MSPQVTAAWIAAGVGVLTVAVTVAAQYFSRLATSRDTRKALAQQSEHLDKTLAAQREQLDTTLAEQRTRTFNERFATAAGQLGSDKPPEVRLAGVYAMAGLADDWEDNRQTCIDVLCAYLRMPYEPDPGDEASVPERLAFRASREVRHTVIRLIGAHLRPEAAVSWQGLNLDFTGVVFDGGDFTEARFPSGIVLFDGAEFSGGQVSFLQAEFSGAQVSFFDAMFSGGLANFIGTEFSGGEVSFNSAEFSGGVVDFMDAEFSGGQVVFGTRFSGGEVSFLQAEFTDGLVYFGAAEFSGGQVDFSHAKFSGSEVDFRLDKFSGGTVDFSGPGDWSTPPAFPWADTPPLGVKLPMKEDQSHA